MEVSEFQKCVDEQIFLGGDLEGEPAIAHHSKICEYIIQQSSAKSPYLLVPLRILALHLFEAKKYAEGLQYAEMYRDLVYDHLYADDYAKCSANMHVAWFLKNCGRVDEGMAMEQAALARLKDLISALDQITQFQMKKRPVSG